MKIPTNPRKKPTTSFKRQFYGTITTDYTFANQYCISTIRRKKNTLTTAAEKGNDGKKQQTLKYQANDDRIFFSLAVG